MNIYLDFETAWDKDEYSLSKMSTEAYIRNPRFYPLLLGVAVNDGPIKVFEPELIPAVLDRLPLADPRVYTFSVNAPFDHSIIEMHYGLKIANTVCTRALCRYTGVSRLTNESLYAMNKFFAWGDKKEGTVVSSGKYRKEAFASEEWAFFKQYCADDVEQLRHHVKQMLPLVPVEALAFDSMSERMYIRPELRLDRPLLLRYREKIILKQEEDMARLQHLFQFTDRDDFLKAIRSRTKFPQMLEELGAECPMKESEARVKSVGASMLRLYEMVQNYDRSKEQRKELLKLRADVAKGVMVPALAKTDLGFMDLMDSDDEDVSLLARVRAENNTSIALSRCQTFLDISSRGAFPASLGAWQAHTGRYTGDNSGESKSDSSNVQNLNKRSGDLTLRRAIRRPKGCVLVAADSAQIEARVNAWVWNENWLTEAFREGRDIYCEFSEKIFFRPITKADKTERNVGKTSELQLGYQSGYKKLALALKRQKVDLSTPNETHDEVCSRIVRVYRETHPAIKGGWDTCREVLFALVRGDSGVFGGPLDNLFAYNGRDNIFDRPAASIRLPDGFKLYYPNLRWVAQGDKIDELHVAEESGFWYDIWDRKLRRTTAAKLYGGKLTNNLIQGLAAAIIRWQMLQIDSRYRVLLQVHDEILSRAAWRDAAKALDFMVETMKTNPPWLPDGPPLNAEGGWGVNYADMYDWRVEDKGDPRLRRLFNGGF